MSDEHKIWYHGSPFHLTVIRAGSTITPDRELARVFSHKPGLVSQDIDDNGQRWIKHSGRQPGVLYRIAEELAPGDVYPHPESTMLPAQEWLTARELRVERIEATAVNADELLTEQESELLSRRVGAQRGITTEHTKDTNN